MVRRSDLHWPAWNKQDLVRGTRCVRSGRQFRIFADHNKADRAALAATCEKLAAKDSMPLFDTTRFTRNLEAAYSDMLDKA